LTATSTEELKKVAGWVPNLDSFGVDGVNDRKTGTGSEELSKQLANEGLNLPPLHFRCRSIIRPI